MYVFALVTGFFLTCSNTTPTITIFVSLLFNKAVSMVKHKMEIVKGNSEFIKVGQTHSTRACFIEYLETIFLYITG